MISLRQNKSLMNRRMIFSVVAGLIMLFFLFGRLNHYLFISLYESNYYRLGIPAMVAVYCAVRGFRDGTEMKILILYMIWAVISRILNGDRFLLIEGDYLIDLSTMILLLAPGILLRGQSREKLFSTAAAIIVVFHLIMAIICIYTAVTRTFLENPIDFWGIGYPNLSENRLYFLSYQWNETAGLFVIAFGLSLMLLFRTKNRFVRAGLLAAAFADFVVVGLTVSRNGQTCVSLIIGLIFGILAVDHLSEIEYWKRIAVFLAACVVGTVLIYQLFEPVRYGIWRFYQRQEIIVNADLDSTDSNVSFGARSADNEGAEDSAIFSYEYSADNRAYLKSGRKEIFWSALKSLQLEPKRLLIGSGYYHVMDISHSLIHEQAKHFHNTFLQVVNEFGLIGLGVVIWFHVRMLICSYQVIFKAGKRIPIVEKMFVLLPLSLMFYYTLEVGIFKIVDRADFRNTFFFFVCGMLVGVLREKCKKETI